MDTPVNQVRRQALDLIDASAAVSAQYNLVTHLAHRPRVYEFPNPFLAVNWGFPGDQHRPADRDAIRFVLVERPLLGQREAALFDQLRAQPQWHTRLDRQGIVLLEHA